MSDIQGAAAPADNAPTIDADEQYCEFCKYYANWDRDGNGFCRRYPPSKIERLSPSSKIYEYAEWPYVSEDSYCGEFVRLK